MEDGELSVAETDPVLDRSEDETRNDARARARDA